MYYEKFDLMRTRSYRNQSSLKRFCSECYIKGAKSEVCTYWQSRAHYFLAWRNLKVLHACPFIVALFPIFSPDDYHPFTGNLILFFFYKISPIKSCIFNATDIYNNMRASSCWLRWAPPKENRKSSVRCKLKLYYAKAFRGHSGWLSNINFYCKQLFLGTKANSNSTKQLLAPVWNPSVYERHDSRWTKINHVV